MPEMSLARALELLKLERECVQRQIGSTIPAESSKCPREWEGTCRGCDLVQSDSDVIQMYNMIIDLVSKFVDAQTSTDWTKCGYFGTPIDIGGTNDN